MRPARVAVVAFLMSRLEDAAHGKHGNREINIHDPFIFLQRRKYLVQIRDMLKNAYKGNNINIGFLDYGSDIRIPGTIRQHHERR